MRFLLLIGVKIVQFNNIIKEEAAAAAQGRARPGALILIPEAGIKAGEILQHKIRKPKGDLNQKTKKKKETRRAGRGSEQNPSPGSETGTRANTGRDFFSGLKTRFRNAIRGRG